MKKIRSNLDVDPETKEDREIRQMCEGREYVWPKKGSVMTVPDNIGNWLLGKLNTPDRSPLLKSERARLGKPAFELVSEMPYRPGEQKEDSGVVVAELPKEKPVPPPAPAPVK